MNGYEHHQQVYPGEDYYWGLQPNELARKALEFLPEDTGGRKSRAVDIGAGERRDAVLFAASGLETLAVDVAPTGLRKAVRLASENDVDLQVQRGDVNTFELVGAWDLIYSIGTIQYLEPQKRQRKFDHFRQHTSPGGLNALFAFTDHHDVPPAPDWGDDEYLYAPGELLEHYSEWQCLYSRSFIFEDESVGIPHQHAAEEYIFQKL
ncbi:MAG: methyltransferase domain-containing protein [Rubrobacteraceae bacterium]